MSWTLKINKDISIKFNEKGEVLRDLSLLPSELQEVLQDKEVQDAVKQAQQPVQKKKGCGCWGNR